ncbi:MAG TPA: hypothetical protein VNU26_02680 [Mycobacteriales bacterium]|nr:hypothetical protein [Mycobacteriales bacterium]
MRECRPDWAAVAHRLAHRAEALLQDPTGALVISIDGSEHYVQWHGEDRRDLYCESSSGLYGGTSLPEARARQLVALGWDRPYEGWGGQDVANFSRLFTAPVRVYDVVRLTCRTLAEVYGALPDDVSWP